MQVEILKFLMDANAHLNDLRTQSPSPLEATDLQAVERALPDCDWFELDQLPQTQGQSDELPLQPYEGLRF